MTASLPRGLIVSCQARADNPLHGPVHMGAMALAAVAAAAHAGDTTVRAILAAAGDELAGLAQVLLARAGEKPVAIVGRVPTLHPVIAETVARRLAGISVLYPEADAARAAARLAASNDKQDLP